MEEKIIKAEITRIDGRDFYVQDLDDCQESFYFSLSDIVPVVWKGEKCEAVNLLEGDIILVKYSGTADGDEPQKIENVISIEVLEFADVKPEED